MDSFEEGGLKLTWLGHAAFRAEFSGKTAYFDPYVLPPNPQSADYLFITHEHYDHCDAQKARLVCKPSTVIACAENCVSKLSPIGATVMGLHEGEAKELGGGFSVKAVPAYNPNKKFHPRGLGVGLVASFGEAKVYHAGDTDWIPEMKRLAEEKISVALLPIGGTYTMDAEEAARAANDILPKYAIPMHYDFLDQTPGDPGKFASLLKKEVKAVVLEPPKKN